MSADIHPIHTWNFFSKIKHSDRQGSIRTKLVTFIKIALHGIAMTTIFTKNDHFFKPYHFDWKLSKLTFFNQFGQVWKNGHFEWK